MVHGVLHLLGYDHETGENDYTEMAAAERKLLKRLGWVGAGQWGVKLQDEVVKPSAPSQEA